MNTTTSIIKSWLFGLFVAALFALSVIGALGQCSKPVPTPNAKIDTILVHRTDTLKVLDTVLKTRVKYIDTSKIDTVHEILNTYIPIDTSDNDGNQVIAANQLRETIKWKDSLNTCIEMRKVDSVAIDSIHSIVRNEKAQSSILDRAKDFGTGVLIGITIRSLF